MRRRGERKSNDQDVIRHSMLMHHMNLRRELHTAHWVLRIDLEVDVHEIVPPLIERQATHAEAVQVRDDFRGGRVELDRTRELVIPVLESPLDREVEVDSLEGDRRLLLPRGAAA